MADRQFHIRWLGLWLAAAPVWWAIALAAGCKEAKSPAETADSAATGDVMPGGTDAAADLALNDSPDTDPASPDADGAAGSETDGSSVDPPDGLTGCPAVFPGELPSLSVPCAVALSCPYVKEHCCGQDYFVDCNCGPGQVFNCGSSDMCGPSAPCSPGCSNGMYTTKSGCQDCATIAKGMQVDMAAALAAAATCATADECIEVPYSLCGFGCSAAVPKSVTAAPNAAAVSIAATWCPTYGKEWPKMMNCWLNCSAGPAKEPMACLSGRCAKVKVCPLGAFMPGDACTDEDACTLGDVCTAPGSCIGKAKNCDDGDACTADACQAGVCQHIPGQLCSLQTCTPQGQLVWVAALAELPTAATLVNGELVLKGVQLHGLDPFGGVKPLALAPGWPAVPLRIGFSGEVTALQKKFKSSPSGYLLDWTACAAPNLLATPACTAASATLQVVPEIWSTDLYDNKVIALVTWYEKTALKTRLWDTSTQPPLFFEFPPPQPTIGGCIMAAVAGPDVAVLTMTDDKTWSLGQNFGAQSAKLPVPAGLAYCPKAMLLPDGGAASACVQSDGLNSTVVRWSASGVVASTSPWSPGASAPNLLVAEGAVVAWGQLQSGELLVRRQPIDGTAEQQWLLPKSIFQWVEPSAVYTAWGDIAVVGKAPGSLQAAVAVRWSTQCSLVKDP